MIPWPINDDHMTNKWWLHDQSMRTSMNSTENVLPENVCFYWHYSIKFRWAQCTTDYVFKRHLRSTRIVKDKITSIGMTPAQFKRFFLMPNTIHYCIYKWIQYIALKYVRNNIQNTKTPSTKQMILTHQTPSNGGVHGHDDRMTNKWWSHDQ